MRIATNTGPGPSAHGPRSTRTRRARSGLAVTLAFVITLIAAPTALAADGEVGDMGDTDSITDLYVTAEGRIHALIDYVRDCPSGLSGCEIQVRFGYRCPELWCLGWSWQTWRRAPLPSGGVSIVKGDCNGGEDIDNEWQMEYRVRWWAPTVKTVVVRGEHETYLGTGGTIVARVIGEGLFNVTDRTGITGSPTLETRTATVGLSAAVQVATTGGRVYRTC